VFGRGRRSLITSKARNGFPLLAIAVFAAGCGGHVLLARNDPTHARAIERQARTRRLVEAAGAGTEEAQMFLQAEAFFRYRFEPPPRTGATYAANATAAMVDLPVLQAYASSLDLFELRLRMNEAP
jgi:hypothetical protein